MKIIAYCSEKGGTGKSSSLILTARAVAEQLNENYAMQELSGSQEDSGSQGAASVQPDDAESKVVRKFSAERRKVLVIDLDTLGSTTMSFKPLNLKEQDPYNRMHIAAAMSSDDADSLRNYIINGRYDGIDLIRSNESIRRITFTQNLIRNKIKAAALDELYDFIFIDTPAAYNPLHISALAAADTIVTPVTPSTFDLPALVHLGSWIAQDIGEDADWHLFFNMMKPQSQKQDEYVQMFKDKIGVEHFYEDMIPDSAKVRDAIDLSYLISHSQNYIQLRSPLCGLASSITGMRIDPKERF